MGKGSGFGVRVVLCPPTFPPPKFGGGGGNIGMSEMVNQMNFPNVQKYTGYVIKWPNMIINDLLTELQQVGITRGFKMGEKEIIQ